jgi:hypothetical protein
MTEAVLVARPAVARSNLSEDWLAVVIGLGVVVAAFVSLGGLDVLGWAVTSLVWTDPRSGLAAVSKSYGWLGGAGALAATFIALLVVLTAAASAAGAEARRFAVSFSVLFVIAYASWFLGSEAHFATVTPADQAAPDQRGRLYRRPHRRARGRKCLSAPRRMAP